MDNKIIPDWIEDTALDFAEEEVGRFDFNNNWPKYRERMGESITGYVDRWMTTSGFVELRPHEIVAYLDDLAARGVRWPR